MHWETELLPISLFIIALRQTVMNHFILEVRKLLAVLWKKKPFCDILHTTVLFLSSYPQPLGKSKIKEVSSLISCLSRKAISLVSEIVAACSAVWSCFKLWILLYPWISILCKGLLFLTVNDLSFICRHHYWMNLFSYGKCFYPVS